MQLVEPDNQRYLLELERSELLQKKDEFDQVYGLFSSAFLTSVQAIALLAYLFILSVLLYYKKTRSKTNLIVAIWALINYIVLLENFLGIFTKWNLITVDEVIVHFSDMLWALARQYGTVLAIIWLYLKYFKKPSENWDYFMYFLIAGPALILGGFMCWYIFYNKFIYEVYGPGCDVVNVVVYITVGFIFLLCKIFAKSEERSTSKYPLLVSLVSLVTNFPICLATIYLRFNLDIGYVYRFHIYLVDFGLKLIHCSGAFAVLFLVIYYNDCIRLNFTRRSKV